MAEALCIDRLEEEEEKHKFEICIGIDFGTDGLGVAYALSNSNEIHVHDKWNSKRFGSIVKPKTIILFDDNFNVVNVGLDAKHSYIDLPNQKDKWLLFERFKMALFDDRMDENDDDDEKKEVEPKRVCIKDELIATNGKRCCAEKVFVAAFKHVAILCDTYLKKQKIKIINDNIQWIITVPAIWTDESKNKMKKWAIKAGLVNKEINNQCKIVYEPDCASLALQYFMKDRGNIYYDADKKKKNKNNVSIDNETALNDDSYKLENGDKYILIDAGGGTVDIACHQVIDEFGVKEIYHPSGGKWGSIYIDDEYIKLLEKIFSKQWIDEFKKQETNQYVSMINYFQHSKETFYSRKSNKTHNVQLPADFCAFIEEKLINRYKESNEIQIKLKEAEKGEYLECFIRNTSIDNIDNLLDYNDGYLLINYIIWQQMFDHVVIPIINHIKYLLCNVALLMSKHLKFICMVGGLSCSKYFQYGIKQEFGLKSKYKLDIIIPHKPILSVVQGAAFLGITPNFVRARKLRKSYGICMDFYKNYAKKIGISDDYINKNIQYDGYVGNCFKVIAHKNEEIYVGHIKKDKNQKRSNYAYIPILCSNKQNPLIADDGKVLATLLLQCDDHDLNDQIVTEFHFYDTLLTAYSYPINTPHKKKQVEINYQE